MKNGLILFNSSNGVFDGKNIESVTSLFKGAGLGFSRLEVLSFQDDLAFSRSLKDFRDTVDNLVVLCSKSIEFDVKKILSEIFESPLVENENALNFIKAVSNEPIEEIEKYALMPSDATLIPNLSGVFQGFMFDNREFTLAVLPAEIKEFSLSAEKYVIPYLEKKYELDRKRQTIKYFGDKAKLLSTLARATCLVENKFSYVYTETYGDFKVDLLFDSSDSLDYKTVMRFLIQELKENIYAEFDTSLSERVFDLLKLKKLKLSVAESFTAGRVASAIISNSGASEFVHEGIVSYSNQSKLSRLNVDKGDLIKNGAVSSVVAYHMAVGLLKTGECDVAISTTGIAGPKSDNTEKPVGLCYIAIGMKDGVHTYKYNLSGNREEITETAKNTALFLTIKKLKEFR